MKKAEEGGRKPQDGEGNIKKPRKWYVRMRDGEKKKWHKLE